MYASSIRILGFIIAADMRFDRHFISLPVCLWKISAIRYVLSTLASDALVCLFYLGSITVTLLHSLHCYPAMMHSVQAVCAVLQFLSRLLSCLFLWISHLLHPSQTTPLYDWSYGILVTKKKQHMVTCFLAIAQQNTLPIHIFHWLTIKSFKSELKTQLFHEHY